MEVEYVMVNYDCALQISVEDHHLNDVEMLEDEEDTTACEVCGQSDREDRLLLCDGCDNGYDFDVVKL